jgi:uncharacterized repeat protein (TIGR01451 family)
MGMRSARGLVILVASGLAAMSFAAPASAALPKRYWPESPHRHILGRHVALKDFSTTPAYAANIRGDVVSVGNTLLTCPANTAKKRRAARAENCSANANNNDQNMKYVNVDPSAGHFNSSTATLTIPAGAHIEKAYLYWGADLAPGVQNGADAAAPGGGSPSTNAVWRTALLRTSATGGYVPIDATQPGRDGRWDYIASWYQQPGQSPGWAYQVRADVTAELQSQNMFHLVRKAGRADQQAAITVANVQAGRGYNRYGGWNLTVIWQNTTAAFRNVTLFDGFEFVQVAGGQELVVGPIRVSGFKTPTTGSADARVGLWAYEGDAGITGDYATLGKVDAQCADSVNNKLTNNLNPATNFFNSTISNLGQQVTDRIPAYVNQLGFDLDRLADNTLTLDHGATGATICLGTSGDTYFLGGLSFSTLIFAPNTKIAKDVDKTSAVPGDVLTYTVTMSNPQRQPGDPLYPTLTSPAINAAISDPLPSGLDFVGFTSNPGGACAYDSATREIDCNVGTLNPDATFTYAVQARVHAWAAGALPDRIVNSACYTAGDQDTPGVVFRGCDDASTTVPPNPAADLGIVKSVAPTVVQAGGDLTWTLTATNYGPRTATGVVIADQLPPDALFASLSAPPGMSCTTPPVGSSGQVTCTVPALPAVPDPASSVMVSIGTTVAATAVAGTTLDNVATVAGNEPEPTPDVHPNRDEATATVFSLEPGPGPGPGPTPPIPPETRPPGPENTKLSLAKHADRSTAHAGDTVTFTLSLRNRSEASALDVLLCDALPSGLTLVKAPGSHMKGGQVCWSMSSLRVGGTRTVHLVARVQPAPGQASIRNPASATARNAKGVQAAATVRVLAAGAKVPPPPPPAVTG